MNNSLGRWSRSFSQFVCLLFLFLVVYPFAALAELPASEEELKETMGMDGYTLVYRMGDGTEISFEQFVKLGASGAFPSFRAELLQDQKWAALILMSVAETAESDAMEELAVETGGEMPALDLPDLAGLVYDYEDFEGQPLLISFYFALCRPCIEEIPELREFARENDRVAVVAITFDSDDEAQAFASKNSFDWPIIPNATDFIDQVGVRTYPMMALVSAQGILMARKTSQSSTNLDGSSSESGWLKRWVDEVLSMSN
jgi:peroxiredoxin